MKRNELISRYERPAKFFAVALALLWAAGAIFFNAVSCLLLPVFFLLECGLFFFFIPEPGKNLLRLALLVFAGIAGLEIINAQSEFIFGEITFGSTAWVTPGGIPVLVLLLWTLAVLLVYDIAGKFTEDPFLRSALSAALLVALDFIAEGQAFRLDLWHWNYVSPTVRNYLAWFFATFFFAYAGSVLKVEIKNPLSRTIFLALLIFFALPVLYFRLFPAFAP
ncbi:MAG TPA: carotenoid biosynthesis protein [Bacteroidia bacterium]|nr:carotenoid biosynthesis protein [Bacteroidia bacterium]